jgi:hypothetical protein
MKSCRIHIMGASGAGVTSLGRALADAMAIPHHDTDDYYWQPTIPPYQRKRERSGRLRLMQEMFLPCAAWGLSGSLDGWGDAIIANFDLVVFLSTSMELRPQRLPAADQDSPQGRQGRLAFMRAKLLPSLPAARHAQPVDTSMSHVTFRCISREGNGA